MGLGKLASFISFAWIMTFTACEVKSQIESCSFPGVDLGMCLHPNNITLFIDYKCCEMLNKIAQVGYNCLCMLLQSSSSIPLLNTPLLLPLSNCFISLPPLSLCPGVKQVELPPDARDEPMEPPVTPEIQVSVHSNESGSTGVAAIQPTPDETVEQRSNLHKMENQTPNGIDKTKIKLAQALFPLLCSLLCCCTSLILS